MRVGVLGTGDVNLVAGVYLAKLGHEVVCAETNCIETNAGTVALSQPRRSLIDAPRLNRLLNPFMQATALGDRGNLAIDLDAGVYCHRCVLPEIVTR